MRYLGGKGRAVLFSSCSILNNSWRAEARREYLGVLFITDEKLRTRQVSVSSEYGE